MQQFSYYYRSNILETVYWSGIYTNRPHRRRRRPTEMLPSTYCSHWLNRSRCVVLAFLRSSLSLHLSLSSCRYHGKCLKFINRFKVKASKFKKTYMSTVRRLKITHLYDSFAFQFLHVFLCGILHYIK